jgi:hypothetical protein
MHSRISRAIVKIRRNFIKLKQNHHRPGDYAGQMTIASFVTTGRLRVYEPSRK